MRRFGFGIGLLVALLIGSLAVWWGMERLHRPIVQDLTRAAVLAEEQNGLEAKEMAWKAEDQWRSNWHFTASFADHTPMEEIDALFAALETYKPDSEEFKACCQQLIKRTEAMAHAHVFNWWSLL